MPRIYKIDKIWTQDKELRVNDFIKNYKKDENLRSKINQYEMSQPSTNKKNSGRSVKQVEPGVSIVDGHGGYLWIVDENGNDFQKNISDQDLVERGRIKVISPVEYFNKRKNSDITNTSNRLYQMLNRDDKDQNTNASNRSSASGNFKSTQSSSSRTNNHDLNRPSSDRETQESTGILTGSRGTQSPDFVRGRGDHSKQLEDDEQGLTPRTFERDIRSRSTQDDERDISPELDEIRKTGFDDTLDDILDDMTTPRSRPDTRYSTTGQWDEKGTVPNKSSVVDRSATTLSDGKVNELENEFDKLGELPSLNLEDEGSQQDRGDSLFDDESQVNFTNQDEILGDDAVITTPRGNKDDRTVQGKGTKQTGSTGSVAREVENKGTGYVPPGAQEDTESDLGTSTENATYETLDPGDVELFRSQSFMETDSASKLQVFKESEQKSRKTDNSSQDARLSQGMGASGKTRVNSQTRSTTQGNINLDETTDGDKSRIEMMDGASSPISSFSSDENRARNRTPKSDQQVVARSGELKTKNADYSSAGVDDLMVDPRSKVAEEPRAVIRETPFKFENISESISNALTLSRQEEFTETVGSVYDRLKGEGVEDKVNEAYVLLKKYPMIARDFVLTCRNWQEMRKNIPLGTPYDEMSKLGIQQVLANAGIVRNIPVSAFLIAGLIEVTEKNSSIAKEVEKLPYQKDKSKTGMERWAKEAQMFCTYLEQEDSLIYEDPALPSPITRGMSHETVFVESEDDGNVLQPISRVRTDSELPNTELSKFFKVKVEPDHKIVDIGWTNNSAEHKTGHLVAKSSCLLNKVLRGRSVEVVRDERTDRKRIEVVDNSKQYESLVLEVEDNGEVICKDVCGSDWTVDVSLMVKHPDMKVPFCTEDTVSVLPIRNKRKVTGENSVGFLLVRAEGQINFYTPSTDGSWRCEAVHQEKNPHLQSYEGYLLSVMHRRLENNNLIATLEGLENSEYSADADLESATIRQKIEENERCMLIELQHAWDQHRLDTGLSDFQSFAKRARRELQGLKATVHLFNDLSVDTECAEFIGTSLEDQLKTINKISAVNAQHLNEHKVHSNHKLVSTVAPATQVMKNVLGMDIFSTESSRDNLGLSTDCLSLSGIELREMYIARLKEKMKQNGIEATDEYISHQINNSREFTEQSRKPIVAYSKMLIPGKVDENTAQRIEDAAKNVDIAATKLKEMRELMLLQSQVYETELLKFCKASPLNLGSIKMARELWINGIYPANMINRDVNHFDRLMCHLNQVNSTANRLEIFCRQLERHKHEVLGLKLQQNNPQQYSASAIKLNLKLAELTEGIQQLKQQMTVQKEQSIATRKMDYFAENKGIQWRSHQQRDIHTVMKKLSSSIEKDQSSKEFVKWGTGSGKSMGIAMNTDSAHSAIPQQARFAKNVLITAPTMNLKQMSGGIREYFMGQDRSVQYLDIVELSNKNKKWWQSINNLNGILAQLKGLHPSQANLVGQDLLNALQSSAPCMLSNADCIILLELERILEEGNPNGISKTEYKKLLSVANKIGDFIRNSVVLADEIAVGCAPFTDTMLSGLQKDVKAAFSELSHYNIEPERLVQVFSGFVFGCKNLVGYSATSGTIATEALLTGESSIDEIRKLTHEDVTTTRQRLLNRLGNTRIVPAFDKEDGIKKVMQASGTDHGYCVLDASAHDKKNAKSDKLELNSAREWYSILQRQRARMGDTQNASLQWIDKNGVTQLYDSNLSRYRLDTNTVFGGALRKVDEDVELWRRDGVLTRDQGVGSDMGALTQDPKTHAVMVGLLGDDNFGGFDALEQLEARGDRANKEPYVSQKTSIIICDNEIEMANRAHGPKTKDTEAEKQLNEAYSLTLRQLKEQKERLDAYLLQSDIASNNELKAQFREAVEKPVTVEVAPSINLTSVSAKEIRESAQEKKLAELHTIWKQQFGDFAANELVAYHRADMNFQMTAKQLLVERAMHRPKKAFLKKNEDAAFRGYREAKLRALYAKEQYVLQKQEMGSLVPYLTDKWSTVLNEKYGKIGDNQQEIERLGVELNRINRELKDKLSVAGEPEFKYIASMKFKWSQQYSPEYTEIDRLWQKRQECLLGIALLKENNKYLQRANHGVRQKLESINEKISRPRLSLDVDTPLSDVVRHNDMKENLVKELSELPKVLPVDLKATPEIEVVIDERAKALRNTLESKAKKLEQAVSDLETLDKSYTANKFKKTKNLLKRLMQHARTHEPKELAKLNAQYKELLKSFLDDSQQVDYTCHRNLERILNPKVPTRDLAKDGQYLRIILDLLGGKPRLVKGSWNKPESVVIDCGGNNKVTITAGGKFNIVGIDKCRDYQNVNQLSNQLETALSAKRDLQQARENSAGKEWRAQAQPIVKNAIRSIETEVSKLCKEAEESDQLLERQNRLRLKSTRNKTGANKKTPKT